MTKEEIDLENRKLDLEENKLKFQADSFEKEKKFNLKQIGIIITSIVSIATIIVSILQFMKSKNTNEKELELSAQQLELAKIEDNRRYSLDLAKFISENHSQIFSSDTTEQALMRDVMLVSFPSEINEIVFRKIKSTKKTEDSKSIWEEGEKQVDRIINENLVDYIVKEDENVDYYITLLDYPKTQVRRKATDFLIQLSESKKEEITNKLLDNILPDKEKNAYRMNFNIAFTLYKMPNGWNSSQEKVNKLLGLRNSLNYSDYHFKKYVELAINNIKEQ
ncbi:hypothetical protein FGF1_08970 [Flavobacteriaceae bacterium GF1]